MTPPGNPPPDNDVLWTRGLRFSHDGAPTLRDVSLHVRTAEILAVTGPRGAGKTTLLDCLSGHLSPEGGEVWFNSVPLHTLRPAARERLRARRFGWVGDAPRLVPELTAWENVALPVLLAGAGHQAARRVALTWLSRLDAEPCADLRPAALARPQRQRVAVARALANEPAVLFADDPTAPLHQQDGAHVLRTLTAAARSHGTTVLLATHTPEVAAVADRSIALRDGRQAAPSPACSPSV